MTYAVHLESDVMVPMRDGVRLAMDVYSPGDQSGVRLDGQWPVILVRTSYSTDSDDPCSKPLLIPPTRIGDVTGVEVVLLLYDLAFFVDGEPVENPQRAGWVGYLEVKLDRYARQVLIHIRLYDLDPSHQSRQWRPPDGA